MKILKANRSFWADGQMKDPRRIIKRGDTFETSDHHAAQLQARGIASPVSSQGAKETQDLQPEQPAAPTHSISAMPAYETQTILPETKETPPAPQENDETAPPDVLKELEQQSVATLKKQAKNAKIRGYSDMNKGQLIKALILAAKGDK